jgi:hypothetical protein
MQRSIGMAWMAGVLIAIAAPLRAQTTIQRAADALNRPQTAPVVETRRTTTTTVIVPQREIIVVERVHGRRHGWWKHSNYRVITVYYDGNRFYRRPFDRRPLRKVVIYQRAGRYYVDGDHRRWEGSRRWDHDDKWKDDDRRRDDDRWRDDDHRRDDDKWKNDDKRKDDNGRHIGQDPDKHKDTH